MDRFKFFNFANPLENYYVMLPDQVTKPREVIAPLRDLGLQIPWTTQTFWSNSKRCKLTDQNNNSIGELHAWP